MNNPTPPQQPGRPTQTARRSHSKLLRCIALVLLALIVLVGLAVLIIWLVVKPKRLVYTIEDASVDGYNLTDNHLNANFDFILRSYNPNHKVSIYYDSMVVSVLYDDQNVAFDVVRPFFQPHRNVARLEVKPVAKYVPLSGSVSRDLRLERSSGGVELEVLVKARIRIKVGAWKSRDRTLKVKCEPVLVHFSRRKTFERTYCDINL